MTPVQATLTETEVKELFKQATAEVLQEQRELLYEVFWEALEDIALAQAIRQGEGTPTVSRETIFRTLEDAP
jgi:hypothetical protein